MLTAVANQRHSFRRRRGAQFVRGDVSDFSAIARTERPMSRHARYIGRVGGLAFALGVGTAVLTGTGVAWAEANDSGPGGSETTAGQHSDGSPGPAKTNAESESNT